VIYFLIYATEDGVGIECGSREQILESIEELKEVSDYQPWEEWPKESVEYWGDRYAVIKGDLVVPKAVEVVTKYELD